MAKGALSGRNRHEEERGDVQDRNGYILHNPLRPAVLNFSASKFPLCLNSPPPSLHSPEMSQNSQTQTPRDRPPRKRRLIPPFFNICHLVLWSLRRQWLVKTQSVARDSGLGTEATHIGIRLG
ncbi:hypothetical protein E4U54_003633 [Claviceps lovelessii]|nr:hypothetical protein E4U54_003633 [Claviceps lovelessii]